MNYQNWYGNNGQYYMQNLQDMRDRIDNQMKQYQQSQMQQPQMPTNLTQNFQLAPQPSNNEIQAKYVNNIDDVKNTFVMTTGLFVNKDFTSMWIKTTDGNIKTFELNEIIETDPKDIEIDNLKQEIQRMREMINYANESNVDNSNNDGTDESKKSTRIPVRKQSNAK